MTRLAILSMWPNDRRQPVDADVDVLGGFLASRDVQIAAARRAGADEHRVVFFRQHVLQRVDDHTAELEIDTEFRM
jgi:hypothetical protein